jgi:hypothetical protein
LALVASILVRESNLKMRKMGNHILRKERRGGRSAELSKREKALASSFAS